MPHDTLPQELLDEIISYTSYLDVPSLALVNRNIQSISYDRLYRDIPTLCPRATILLLKTLSKRPPIASIVRIITILDLKKYGLMMWTASFFRLLSNALRNMHNLIDLRLHIAGQYAMYLMGCPFKLRRLRIACDWNQNLIEWFREQEEIRDLWLLSIRHDLQVEVSPTILPLLNRTLGSVKALSCLVPKRPVGAVDISFPIFDGFNPEVMALTCRILSHSTGPLIELFFTPDLNSIEVPHILETLAVVPDILPDLHSFGLFVAKGSVSARLAEGFGEVLSKFKCLKKASLYSADKHDALRDHLITKDLAQRWHKTCTTLMSIDLNGIPWLYLPKGGWMTTEAYRDQMIGMLGEARKEEARLRKRLREVQEKNATRE